MSPTPDGGPDSQQPSLGELSRNLANLTEQLRDVVKELRDLPHNYVTRAEHELQIGGIKVDLQRHEREDEALSDRIDATIADQRQAERDRITGNRWAIGLGATAIGLVLTATSILFAVLPRLLGGS